MGENQQTSKTLEFASNLTFSPCSSSPDLPPRSCDDDARRSSKRRQCSRLKPAVGKRRRRTGIIAVGIGGFALVLLVVNVWMSLNLHDDSPARRQRDGEVDVSFGGGNRSASSLKVVLKKDGRRKLKKGTSSPFGMYGRLLALAAHALAEGDMKPEPRELWREPKDAAALWRPCAEQQSSGVAGYKSNGFIIVTANGGINQQRVAICNSVAVSRLLNATLVVPKFQYNNVWRDRSQFGDIYQEEHFINYLRGDVKIVKELPLELKSLDLEAVGSLITDSEVPKEAKPSFFIKKILPVLLKNEVVHFVGFGHRLAFDPVPQKLQRLRCRCNFHALQFVEKIQHAGALLIQRLHKQMSLSGPVEHNLLGQFSDLSTTKQKNVHHTKPSRYLAVHLRFEIDMAAYSLCSFGGGKEEEEELELYRQVHFPALIQLKKTVKMPSAEVLRSEGLCPLTPEEAILMIAALGFKRKTQIYIASADVYGGKTRMAALYNLYPNIMTKEKLLSSTEIGMFMNSTSQLAALDFIACVASDTFAMTDSGSQFSSLVAGYRMYYGGGRLPTIRPNKRRLASIFIKNSTIEWNMFEKRVRKAVRQNKRVIERPIARSIYRHPRCRHCMCRTE